jgi:hypothetical protein
MAATDNILLKKVLEQQRQKAYRESKCSTPSGLQEFLAKRRAAVQKYRNRIRSQPGGHQKLKREQTKQKQKERLLKCYCRKQTASVVTTLRKSIGPCQATKTSHLKGIVDDDSEGIEVIMVGTAGLCEGGCGYVLGTGHLAHIELTAKYNEQVEELNNHCLTCKSGVSAYINQIKSNDFVKHRMLQTTTVRQYNPVTWPTATKNIIMEGTMVFDIIPHHMLYTDISFIQWKNKPISIRHLALTHNPPSKDHVAKALGGAFPHHQSYPVPVNAKLGKPENVTFGLITIPTHKSAKGNYILFASSLDSSDNHIAEFSAFESKVICNMPTARRQGGTAAGFYIPQKASLFDPAALSNCTKHERAIIHNNGTTRVNSTCYYYNKDKDRVIKFNQVYNDILMTRLSTTAKRKQLISVASYRSITIKEMESRLKALMVLETQHLLRMDGITSFAQATKRASEYKTQSIWKKADQHLTFWQIIMLEYSCGTGEMRNHQNTYSHIDGNKSSFLETMTLFGRLHNDGPYNATHVLNEMANGMLSLLFWDIVLDIKCGDVLHMNLDDTVHLADESRCQYNWSKVHGP